jgi:predicted small metal-binding protein
MDLKSQAKIGCFARPAPILRTVSRVEPKKELVVRCECGFETRGTEDQIVPALQKHAGEAHNMKVTRDQVLARAQPI